MSNTAEAMRESEVENAVRFLQHANVRESEDVGAKRAFLTSKGVREREIDEAFRRCGASGSGGFDGGVGFGGAHDATGVARTSFAGSVTRAAAMVGLAYLAWPKARETAERARARLARAIADDARSKANGAGDGDDAEGGGSVSRAVEALEARELANKVATAAEAAERAAKETKQLRDEISSEVSHALRKSVSDVKELLAEARLAAEEGRTKASTVSVEVEASFKRAIDDVKKELREELQSFVAQSPTMATTPTSMDDRLASELRAEISQLKEIMMGTPTSRGGGGAASTATAAGKSSVARDWPFETSPPGSESGESPVYTPVQMLRPDDDEFTSQLLRRDDGSGSRSAPPKSSGAAAEPPHPQNFMDILEMLEAGKTPPGIRDIDDQPPNPTAAIPRTSRTPPGKPWGIRSTTSAFAAEDDAEDENVPIKRIVANAVESPWRPPAAPTLSRVMSQSPRSPRRSVERSASPTNESPPALSVSKTVI